MQDDFTDLASVANKIFHDAKCQQDCNARLGEFVFALKEAGWIVHNKGKVVFRGPSQGDVTVTEWSFEWVGR